METAFWSCTRPGEKFKSTWCSAAFLSLLRLKFIFPLIVFPFIFFHILKLLVSTYCVPSSMLEIMYNGEQNWYCCYPHETYNVVCKPYMTHNQKYIIINWNKCSEEKPKCIYECIIGNYHLYWSIRNCFLLKLPSPEGMKENYDLIKHRGWG